MSLNAGVGDYDDEPLAKYERFYDYGDDISDGDDDYGSESGSDAEDMSADACGGARPAAHQLRSMAARGRNRARRRRRRQKNGSGKRERKLRKRCCWGRLSRAQCACVTFLLTTVVGSLLGVLLVGRLVAEKELNSAKVSFKALDVQDPVLTASAYGNWTVQLRFRGSVNKRTPLDAHVAATAMDVLVDTHALEPETWDPGAHHRWQKVGAFHVPAMDFDAHKAMHLDITGRFTISNSALFAAYNLHMVRTSRPVRFRTSGSLDIRAHLWWFMYISYNGLSYDNEVHMDGMNGFQNVTVNNFDLPYNAPDGQSGVVIKINATLWNPSCVTVPVGGTVVDTYYRRNATNGMSSTSTSSSSSSSSSLYSSSPSAEEFLHIGQISVPPFVLSPGANHISMHGVLNPTQDADDELTAFFSQYVAGRVVHVEVHGTSVEHDEPVWVDQLVRQLRLTMPVVSTLDLNVVRSMNIHSVNVTFDDAGDPVIGANVSSMFANPFEFPLQIMEIGMKVDMLDLATGTEVVGTLDVGRVPVDSRMGVDEVGVHFGSVVVFVTSQEGFNDFVVGMLQEKSITVVTNVLVNVVIRSNMGVMHVNGIPIDGLGVRLVGMDGFQGISVSNGPLLSGLGPQEDVLQVASTIYIGNPSPVAANIGELIVNITYRGVDGKTVVIGHASLPEARISLGMSTLVADAVVVGSPEASPYIAEFFSRYIVRDDNIFVGMQGRPDSTHLKLLEPVLGKTSLALNFRPPAYAFILHVKVRVKVIKVLFGGVTAYVNAYNPLPDTVEVNELDIDVYAEHSDDMIYTMKLGSGDKSLQILPGTHEIEVPVPIGGLHWSVLKHVLGIVESKKITVNLRGKLGFIILPSFHQKLDYVADGVTAHVDITFD